MTRRIRHIMILIVANASVLLCAIVWFFIRESRGIRVGTAVVSKTLCSGVFVSGLDPDLLHAEAVKPNPGPTLLAKCLDIRLTEQRGKLPPLGQVALRAARSIVMDSGACSSTETRRKVRCSANPLPPRLRGQ